MKPPAFDYVCAASIADALALLEAHGAGAVLLAGGQSLMPTLNFRLAAPSVVIDLNGIASLSAVELDDRGWVVAGAMARHRFFETSAMIEERLPLVRDAMAVLAHVAVRNRGTIGGSLCHADPSAEWPALSLACDAEMVLQSRSGTRRVKADEFSLALFTTALAPGELLSQVVFPPWPSGRRWGFQEVSRRRGDFAIAGVVCVVDLDEAGTCTDARIVVFGATDRPTLQLEAASELIGRRPRDDDAQRAALRARAAVACRSDHHASAEYRSQLVQALTVRALTQALQPTLTPA
ncbi:MAG: xanthine dehydrogenase family protein subunit M [Caldimonas sp.]